MTKTTKSEKQYAKDWIHRFVGYSGQRLSVKRYSRLMVWLNGDTFAKIAQDEGVSTQAIARSVKRDLSRVLEFAKQNDKDYTVDTAKEHNVNNSKVRSHDS